MNNPTSRVTAFLKLFGDISPELGNQPRGTRIEPKEVVIEDGNTVILPDEVPEPIKVAYTAITVYLTETVPALEAKFRGEHSDTSLEQMPETSIGRQCVQVDLMEQILWPAFRLMLHEAFPQYSHISSLQLFKGWKLGYNKPEEKGFLAYVLKPRSSCPT